jgi:hypothetical protein
MLPDEAYIARNWSSFDLLGVSSHEVRAFTWEGEEYIVKRPNLAPDALSPFWWGLRAVFGSDFERQRAHLPRLLGQLDNPHIPVARLVAVSQTGRYQLFRRAQGAPYAPDAFPPQVAYQLGQFMGCIHQRRRPGYGLDPEGAREPFGQRMLAVMDQLIQRFWADRPAVRQRFEALRGQAPQPEYFCPIMPDISANQFVYAPDLSKITALVDCDAYVAGPRQWELCVVELCLEAGEDFQRGYETYQPLPSLAPSRDFYRLYTYLCDPWEAGDLEAFLRGHILFS